MKISGFVRRGIKMPVPTPKARPAANKIEGPKVGIWKEDERRFQKFWTSQERVSSDASGIILTLQCVLVSAIDDDPEVKSDVKV